MLKTSRDAAPPQSHNTLQAPAATPINAAALADADEQLRYLGAAVIMRWSTIPTKLQRELFCSAGAMGDLLRTTELRARLARLLHKHSQ
jgi:hypothetical protein